MRRLLRISFALALCMIASCPQMDARGRNNNGGSNTQQIHQPASPQRGRGNAQPGLTRPGNGQPNHGFSNPGNGQPNHGFSNPGNGQPNSGFTRPSNSQPNPGHSNPGNGQPNHGFTRPGNSQPNPGFTPAPSGQRPSHISHVPQHAPIRTMLPPISHFSRPIPPANFRPTPRSPRFGTILGIALGSAIAYTVQQLINTGYDVSGYTNNAVYVNDAMMLNMMWPSSTLYYDNGQLYGSEFVYSTPFYDTSRYYSSYNTLVRDYGAPVSSSVLPGGGMSATWYGYDGRYITLQFANATAQDGIFRYYTTLSFGN